MRPSARLFATLCSVVVLLVARESSAQFWDSAIQIEHDPHYALKTGLLSAGTLATIAVNAGDHPPGWVGALGFAGGTLQIVYATRAHGADNNAQVINYFVGGAAVITGLSALSRNAASSSSTSARSVSVAPLVAMDEDRVPMAGASFRF